MVSTMGNDVFSIIKLAQRLLTSGCSDPGKLTDAVHEGDWETVKELTGLEDEEFDEMCDAAGVEIDE